MIARKHWKRYYQDNLVIRVLTKDGQMFSQGKRLPKDVSENIRMIQREYVKGGTVPAVKAVKEDTGLSLRECLETFNVLRGIKKGEYRWTEV